MMRNDRALLSFLVAGVQKGGTSALHAYLSELPDLQLPPAKELHFFDDEERVDWSAPDYAPLHANFADDGRLKGEATPITLYWPNALERARAYNPALKLILIFRDPVERAWSHWRMEWARRKETEPFAWAIRDGRARVAAGPSGHHRVFSYVERGFYGAQLARALALFPREQLLLLRSSELAGDPGATIGRVAGFLGVPEPRHVIVPKRVRVGAAIDYPSTLGDEDVALLQRLYAEDHALFHRLSGFGNF